MVFLFLMMDAIGFFRLRQGITLRDVDGYGYLTASCFIYRISLTPLPQFLPVQPTDPTPLRNFTFLCEFTAISSGSISEPADITPIHRSTQIKGIHGSKFALLLNSGAQFPPCDFTLVSYLAIPTIPQCGDGDGMRFLLLRQRRGMEVAGLRDLQMELQRFRNALFEFFVGDLALGEGSAQRDDQLDLLHALLPRTHHGLQLLLIGLL
jgi:hypothetical protein